MNPRSRVGVFIDAILGGIPLSQPFFTAAPRHRALQGFDLRLNAIRNVLAPDLGGGNRWHARLAGIKGKAENTRGILRDVFQRRSAVLEIVGDLAKHPV